MKYDAANVSLMVAGLFLLAIMFSVVTSGGPR